MSDEARQLVTGIEKLLSKKYGSTGWESQRKLFKEYDADKDGKIRGEELETLLKDAAIGNALTRGAWVRGVIFKMDGDSDGRISWDEYERVIRETTQEALK